MARDEAAGHVWLEVGPDEAAAVTAALDAAETAGDLPRLPAPAALLSSHRALAGGPPRRAVVASLAAHGVDAHPVEPTGWLGPRGGTRWRRLPLTRPDVRLAEVSLPVAVVEARSRIALAAVRSDDVAPIALDLLTRYAHPRLRLVLRTAREREALAAELNLACRLDLLIVCGILGTIHVAAVTRDVIAAELLGLALREDPFVTSRELSGLWEDAVVQRATELDLGVALPSQLRLHQPREAPVGVSAALDRIRLRLGIPSGTA